MINIVARESQPVLLICVVFWTISVFDLVIVGWGANFVDTVKHQMKRCFPIMKTHFAN